MPFGLATLLGMHLPVILSLLAFGSRVASLEWNGGEAASRHFASTS